MQKATGEPSSSSLASIQQSLDPGVYILKDFKKLSDGRYGGRNEVWYGGNYDRVEHWVRVENTDTVFSAQIPKHENLDTVVARTEEGKSNLWQITDQDAHNTTLTKLPDEATINLVTDPFKVHVQGQGQGQASASSSSKVDRNFLFDPRADQDEDETGSIHSQSTLSSYVSSQRGDLTGPISGFSSPFSDGSRPASPGGAQDTSPGTPPSDGEDWEVLDRV